MFDQLVNGQQEPQGFGPPKDQTDYQNRVGMWQQFQDKVKSDPAFRIGLMQAAVQLMQPIQPGQSTLGHIGQAFGLGTQAYALANNAADERRRQEEELTMKKNESAARVEHSQAQTGLTREQITTEPVRRQQLSAQTANVESEMRARDQETPVRLEQYRQTGNYYGALAEYNKIKADIEKQYGGREAEAKIARERAAAAASWASAAHAQALATKAQNELKADKGWTSSAPKVDDNGIATIVSTNRTTGEIREIRSIPPMDYSQAVARAKQTVKAIEDATPGQLFGTSADRLKALEREVGEPVKSTQEAVTKLAERLKNGGTYVRITDSKGTRIVKDESGLTPPQAASTTPPASGQSGPVLPDEVAQALRDNRGMSGTYTATDGTQWRFDGRGGASQVGNQSKPTQQTTPTQPSTGTTPLFRDSSQMSNDPTLKGLDVAIQQAATAGDSAKVQELTTLRQQHIQRNYLK